MIVVIAKHGYMYIDKQYCYFSLQLEYHCLPFVDLLNALRYRSLQKEFARDLRIPSAG